MPPSQPQAAHIGLLLPLCSSSATVGLALYQYPQFWSFLNTTPSIAGKPLSRYWDPMVKSAYVVITANAIVSTVSGIIAARWLSTHQTLETTDVGKWYTYGAVLAAGHMAFVPLILGPVKRMIEAGTGASTKSEEDTDKSNREEMKSWLTIHTARTLLVDLPALVCFAEGAALSFWIANA